MSYSDLDVFYPGKGELPEPKIDGTVPPVCTTLQEFPNLGFWPALPPEVNAFHSPVCFCGTYFTGNVHYHAQDGSCHTAAWCHLIP